MRSIRDIIFKYIGVMILSSFLISYLPFLFRYIYIINPTIINTKLSRWDIEKGPHITGLILKNSTKPLISEKPII